MKKILITGGSGFLGSKITEMLLSEGYEVVILIRRNSSLKRLDKLISNPKLTKFFIEDGLEKCFNDHDIESIIHTATCYGRQKESYTEILEANLILPLKLFIVGERFGTKSFLNADTFFNEKIIFEKDENLYVQTKKYFVKIIKDIIIKTNLKFFNLKIEQMYGPNDSPEKFIPFIIDEISSYKKNIPLTLGEQKRDFIFVDDVARAFISTIKKQEGLKKYEEFCIGSGKSNSIKEIVKYIKKITKSNSNLNFGELEYRKNEIMDSFANLSNNVNIDWKADVTWEEGMKKTIDFYLSKKI